MNKFFKKCIEIFEYIAEILEILMALVVVAGIIFAIVKSVPELYHVFKTQSGLTSLNSVLEGVFSIAIAIEFLKMLLKPSSKTVVEVLVFLIARHMIVLELGAVDTLLSVLSIALLLALEFLIEKFKNKDIG